jgi:hypothetical protein
MARGLKLSASIRAKADKKKLNLNSKGGGNHEAYKIPSMPGRAI